MHSHGHGHIRWLPCTAWTLGHATIFALTLDHPRPPMMQAQPGARRRNRRSPTTVVALFRTHPRHRRTPQLRSFHAASAHTRHDLYLPPAGHLHLPPSLSWSLPAHTRAQHHALPWTPARLERRVTASARARVAGTSALALHHVAGTSTLALHHPGLASHQHGSSASTAHPHDMASALPPLNSAHRRPCSIDRAGRCGPLRRSLLVKEHNRTASRPAQPKPGIA